MTQCKDWRCCGRHRVRVGAVVGDDKVPREDSSRLSRMMAKGIGVMRSRNWGLCVGLVFYVCTEFV